MGIGLIGKKLGQSRVYDQSGVLRPVTIVHVGPNKVLQVRNNTTDGYEAVQLGFGERKATRSSKARLGHMRKHLGKAHQQSEASSEQSNSSLGPVPARVREFRNFGRSVSSGDLIGASLFAVGDYIDAIGITKGRGFEGVVRRHAFRGGDSTHGAKGWHRRSGAIGQRLFPGTVMRGMKMPGHMGRVRRTIQNLEVVQVRENDNLLLIAGAIPGANGDYVIVKESVKKSALRRRAQSQANRAGAPASHGKGATSGASKASGKKS